MNSVLLSTFSRLISLAACSDISIGYASNSFLTCIKFFVSRSTLLSLLIVYPVKGAAFEM